MHIRLAHLPISHRNLPRTRLPKGCVMISQPDVSAAGSASYSVPLPSYVPGDATASAWCSNRIGME